MSDKDIKPAKILLVEDDRVDVKAFQRAMKKLKIANPIHVCRDGVEAYDYLEDSFQGDPLEAPSLTVLDINMPRMNGIELLEKIRQNKRMRHLVVFMLTTSNDDQDKFDAYNLNVAGYMLKSDMGNSFIKAVKLVDNYWRVVEFPNHSYIPRES
ncbi:MAG: response regulator [Gammaproteobacteria bacterium]|nr:response regulator [Gammaproteobacteria bacterium]